MPNIDEDVIRLLGDVPSDDLLNLISALLKESPNDNFHHWLRIACFQEFCRKRSPETQTQEPPRLVCVDWRDDELTDAGRAAAELSLDAEKQRKPQVRAIFDRIIEAFEEERRNRPRP